MKKVTAALWLGLSVSVVSAAAFADDNQPQILNSSAGAVSGANRLGGATNTAPLHAWTTVGQSPEALSTDDTKKETPRNPSIVGPPVPGHATLPPPQAQPQGEKSQTEQPATEQPAAEQPASTDE
jgi:hypothetical protein